MQLSLPMKRLLWKDGRQILPLVLLIVGVSVFIHSLFFLSPTMPLDEADELLRGMLIAIPMCYSIGAAAVSISIEKENNQMLWLNGLPIDGSRVAGSKLVVILAGWLAVWLVSLVMYESIHFLWLGRSLDFPRYENGLVGFTGSLSVHVVQSFLMLAIGVMVAWRLQTTWIAILAMFLTAMIPFHAQVIYVYLVQSHRWLKSGSEIANTLIAALFSLVFLVVGWRFALQFWAREIPRASRAIQWEDLVASWFPNWTQSAVASREARRHSPSSALVWRQGQQHCSIFAVLFGGVLTALISIAVFSRIYKLDFFSSFSFVMAFVGCAVTSWTGWLVFRTDARRQSIRFLSDRGVSPSRLWWTQQSVSFAFLCLLALAILGAIRLCYPETHAWTWMSLGIIRQFLFLLLVYSLSQWISFVIPKPVFAAIVAPLVGTSLAIFLWVEAGLIYPDPWIAALLIAWPLVVTRVFFRSWMDGRLGWRFWASQAGCLLLLLLLPQFQHLSPLWNPAMPASFRSKVADEALLLAKQSQTSVKFLQFDNTKPDPDRDYVERVQAKVREMLSSNQQITNWEFPGDTLSIVVGEIVSTRIQIRELDSPTRFPSLKHGASSGSNEEDLKERYNESIGFLVKIVSLLRQSSKIADQDRGDLLEIWLLREALQKDSGSILTTASYNKIVDQLRDQEARYQARRRAIVLSWHKAWTKPEASEMIRKGLKRKTGQGPSLGGYELNQDGRWSWHNRFFNTMLHKVDFVTREMLDSLDQGRQRNSDDAASSSQSRSMARDEMLRRIDKAWSGSTEAFAEAYGPRTDVIEDMNWFSPESPIHYGIVYGYTSSSQQWYGEWERVGSKLEKR